MHRPAPGLLIGLALLGLSSAAAAKDDRDCGGDAYSSAVVIEKRPPRRGPIVSVPDTLCADLAAPPSSVTVDVYANPIVSGNSGENGADAPYQGRPSPTVRPPRPMRP